MGWRTVQKKKKKYLYIVTSITGKHINGNIFRNLSLSRFVSVDLLFVSVQSKHRNSLFRYRSETTETNVLFRFQFRLLRIATSFEGHPSRGDVAMLPLTSFHAVAGIADVSKVWSAAGMVSFVLLESFLLIVSLLLLACLLWRILRNFASCK